MKIFSHDLRSSCRALLIGAYQNGCCCDDEEWVYPPEWLQMPSAAEKNTGYFLLSEREEKESFQVEIPILFDSYLPGYVNIDWGDGTVEEFNKDHSPESSGGGDGGGTISGTIAPRHTYQVSKGHRVANGTRQFMIKIVSEPYFDSDLGAWFISNQGSTRSYFPLKAASYYVDMDWAIARPDFGYGSTGFLGKRNGQNMSYIALSGDVGRLLSRATCISDQVALQKIDVTSTSKITELASYNFNYCQYLPKKSVQKIIKDVRKIGNDCFSGGLNPICSTWKLNFPELVEMGDYCFQSSLSLFKFEAPKLKKMGRGCFRNLNNLNYFIASDEFDMEAAKANDCFAYSPQY